MSDDVKAVAESLLVAGTHPNLRLVAEAALRADALESRIAAALAFDDETFSTSSHYRIGWQDAVRAMKRVLAPSEESGE